jgi:hypothetical protein
MSDAPQLRTEVRDLLTALDQSFAPADPAMRDAGRHAFRLRFALARVEEQAQAAIMQSALYEFARFDIAMAILRLDIDRARTFLRGHAVSVNTVGRANRDRVEAAEPRPMESRAA